VSFICLLFAGCVTPQPLRHIGGYSVSVGEKAADTARSLVGKPYKNKGDSPEGFDCSGLVRYSYLIAGMDVPHGTTALRQQTHPVLARDFRKGDLVFFTQLGKKYSHVGIYIGNNRFVHAPSSGKSVRIDNLTDSYWKKYFLGARRF
jgi:cell wall-associated NlpC family hydrolase